MPGYKKPMMYNEKKPMAHHGKKAMMYDKKPQFNAKLKQAAKEGKLDGSPKFKSAVEKSMMYKPMKHKGPYKLGSMSKNNTEGIFRKEVPQMYHSKKPMMFKTNKNPMKTGEKSNIDPDLVKEAVKDFKVRKPKTQGDSISLTHTMRKVGKDPQSVTDSRFRFYEKAGPKGGLKSMKEKIAEAKAKRKGK
jgi:hypothetical protein